MTVDEFKKGLGNIRGAIDSELRRRGVKDLSVAYSALSGQRDQHDARFTVTAEGKSIAQDFTREEIADSHTTIVSTARAGIRNLVGHFTGGS